MHLCICWVCDTDMVLKSQNYTKRLLKSITSSAILPCSHPPALKVSKLNDFKNKQIYFLIPPPFFVIQKVTYNRYSFAHYFLFNKNHSISVHRDTHAFSQVQRTPLYQHTMADCMLCTSVPWPLTARGSGCSSILNLQTVLPWMWFSFCWGSVFGVNS